MKKKNKHTSTLSVRQLIGLGILTLLIAGTIAGIALIDKHTKSEVQALAINDSRADSFLLQLRQSEKQFKSPQYQREKDKEVPVVMSEFDPNTVDSLSLRCLGLKGWQARTLIRYRAAGARFEKKEDLKRLFFMTDSMYLALEPYVRIAPLTEDSMKRDTLLPKFAYREKKDTIIELNSSDTTELMYIKGIGKTTALRIIKRRKELGGFVSAEQLRELNLRDVDSIIPHFIVDTQLIEKINVNTASVERLSNHPYIRFEQAKAIYTMRRQQFRFQSLKQIEEEGIFTEFDFMKVRPYLTVE